MKKKKRNFIIKIFSLLLLGIISVTLLGSWTYNPTTDTITSENLFNNTYNYNNQNASGVSISINGNKCLLNGTSNNGFFNTIGSLTLEPNTYSFKEYILSGSVNTSLNRLKFGLYDTENPALALPNELGTFTIAQTTTINIVIWFGDSNINFNNCYIGYMLNVGTTVLPYEPYGIYVNQSTHSHTNEEYDFILSEAQRLLSAYNAELETNRQLRNSYNDLQQQYNTLQSDFTTLQDNYNTLQSQFTTLQNNYNALQTEYNNLQLVVQEKNATIDSLENQLQDLQEDYDELYQTWVDEVAQLNIIISQLKQNAFNINDYTLSVGRWTQIANVPVNIYVADNNLTISDYLSTNGLLNVDSIFTDYIEGQSRSLVIALTCDYFLSVVNDNISFTPLILSNVFKVIIPLYYNGIGLGNFEFYPISNLNPNSKLDLYSIISNDTRYANYNLSGLTYRDIYLEYPDSSASLLGYLNLRNNDSYNQGYYQGTIDTSNKFSELSNNLSTLQGKYNNLEQRYETLLTDYNTLVNTPVQLNFRNLIWYIAETPFTSFKTIWNVDFLGLNIASFITGILSIWLVIFIIRKIFK